MITEQSLITSPFTGKTLQFSNENTLITPSGNRLYAYNLHTNRVDQINQSRFNVKSFTLSQQGNVATIDDQYNLMVDDIKISGKDRQIKQIQYSPDGKMIAVARKDRLTIYNLQMQKIKKHSNKHAINGICWSPDSRFILSWGEDNTVIMNAVFPLRLYIDSMLQAHKFKIASAFYYSQREVVTIDCLGKVCLWKWVDDYLTDEFRKYQQYQKARPGHQIQLIQGDQSEYSDQEKEYMSPFEQVAHKGRFVLEKKLNLKEQLISNFNAIKSVNYHNSNLLVLGMKNGLISILRFEMDQQIFLSVVQSFQITTAQIDSIAINTNGNWIGLGIRSLGQLIVWEWRSQSYILNQQALSYETSTATLDRELQTLAIGTIGGVIRLYDYSSNFCVGKFDDQHTTKITALKFCPSKQGVLISCSLDGTVRAYDIIRLKCFRVMQAEVPNQFHCMDIDQSGDLICVGGFDPYEIYIFSLQTGQLVEVIAGHQSPIVQLRFTQNEDNVFLISGSWDKTIRMHDIFARGQKEAGGELMLHNSEVTALDVYEKYVAVATMGGELVVWDIKDGQIIYSFDVHRDIQGGRNSRDMFGANKNNNYKHFITLQYSKDGNYLIGGGNSKFLCLYDTKYRVLIRKLIISNNMSLDGMKLLINFSKIDQENINIEQSEDEYQDNNLPGSKNYDVGKRSTKRVSIQVHHIEYSESNRQLIIAHCEGVSIFGYDQKRQYFDPILMDESITIQQIQQSIQSNDYIESLLLCLKLNQQSLTQQVFSRISIDSIPNIVNAIPDSLIYRLIETIIKSMQQSRNIEINLLWINEVLIQFHHLIKGPQANKKIQSILQEVIKQIKIDFNRVKDPVRKCINQLQYLSY